MPGESRAHGAKTVAGGSHDHSCARKLACSFFRGSARFAREVGSLAVRVCLAVAMACRPSRDRSAWNFARRSFAKKSGAAVASAKRLVRQNQIGDRVRQMRRAAS